jgi:hypothetical protein
LLLESGILEHDFKKRLNLKRDSYMMQDNKTDRRQQVPVGRNILSYQEVFLGGFSKVGPFSIE